MDFPDWFLQVADEAAQRHPNDVPAAVSEATARVLAHEEYQSLIGKLTRVAVQDHVYQARRRQGQRVRVAAETKAEAPAPRARPMNSPGVQQAAAAALTAYDTPIGGRRLGDLLHEDLGRMARRYRQRGNGSLARARLLDALQGRVAPGQRVRDALEADELQKVIDRTRRGRQGVA